jgi:O-acetyl-ADP-ribose deacetylase (regulator of RNase III)
MLTYRDDSIFDSPAQTLVNTVNTVGVMGKGLALAFKQRYPQMYPIYRQRCREGTFTVGRLQLWRGPDHWVLNFPTKEHWANPSRLPYLEAGLDRFLKTYVGQQITSIAFPRLGCTNGGLDWEGQVRPLMESRLRDVPIPVYIHLWAPA